jgi:hypothetical protein
MEIRLPVLEFLQMDRHIVEPIFAVVYHRKRRKCSHVAAVGGMCAIAGCMCADTLNAAKTGKW